MLQAELLARLMQQPAVHVNQSQRM
jgi:hypothetical protein